MKTFLKATVLAASALAATVAGAIAGPADPVPVAAPAIASPADAAADAALTAEQIVDRNIAARGGLDAWRKLETMVWVGHVESDRLPQHGVSFMLEEKRPNKSRFEILGSGQQSVRVFDGSHGWKVKPNKSGMGEVDAFSPFEVRFAREAPGLDGPLVDYQAKGSRVALQGRDRIDGRDCYRLLLTTHSGEHDTVWVDAQTFLEVRYDRPSYSRDGAPGTVSVYFRDYRTIGGLQLPSVLEIGVTSGMKPDRLVIEKVALNPSLDDQRFARPPAPPHRAEVTISPMLPPPAPSGSAPEGPAAR